MVGLLKGMRLLKGVTQGIFLKNKKKLVSKGGNDVEMNGGDYCLN